MINIKNLLKGACCLLIIGVIESAIAMGDNEFKLYVAVFVFGIALSPLAFIELY